MSDEEIGSDPGESGEADPTPNPASQPAATPGGTGPGSGSGPGSFVPPTIEALDTVLSQYEFIEMLGHGGMGAVYKARQRNLDRMVAIKLLPAELGGEGQEFAERFKREAQALAKLNHPNIVAVYDFGQTSGGQLYFVMEFVEGTDLHQVIRSRQATPEHVLGWIPQVCDALQYAHSKGVVHRDIKPANILIDLEGVVKVADFGLAKLSGDDVLQTQLTMTNLAMGTPDYVAPETLETGMTPDYRADIYAVGVILYEMLTGSVPRGAFKSPSQRVAGLDSRYDALVAEAMDADRDTRIQQASEISGRLAQIRTQPAPTGGPAVVGGGRKVPRMTGPVSVGAGAGSGASPASSSGARPVSSGRSKVEAPAASRAPLWIGIATAAALAVGGLVVFLATRGDKDSIDVVEAGGGAAADPVQSADDGGGSSGSDGGGGSEMGQAADANPAAGEISSETSEPGPMVAESSGGEPPAPAPGPVPANAGEAGGDPSGSEAQAGEAVTVTAEADLPWQPVAPAEPEELSPAAQKLEALFTRYEEGYERTMLAPHEEAVARLDTNYLGAVKREMGAASSAGQLDAVLQFRSEIGRVEAGEPLGDGDEGLPASLANLRATYRQQLARLEGELSARADSLVAPLDQQMAAIETEFTRSGEVEAALEVRAARTRVAEEGLPFLAVAEDPGEPATVATVAEEPPGDGVGPMPEPLPAGERLPGSGEVVQVSPDGGGGTLTLEAALANAKSGQVLLLAEGAYPDGSVIDKSTDRVTGFHEIAVDDLTLIGERAFVRRLVVNADRVRIHGLRLERLWVSAPGYMDLEKRSSVGDITIDSCVFDQIAAMGRGTTLTVTNSLGVIREGDSNTLTAIAKFELSYCTIGHVGDRAKGGHLPRMGGQPAEAEHCLFYSPTYLFELRESDNASLRFVNSYAWSSQPLVQGQADNADLDAHGILGLGEDAIIDPGFVDPGNFPAGFRLKPDSLLRGKAAGGTRDPGANLDEQGWPIFDRSEWLPAGVGESVSPAPVPSPSADNSEAPSAAGRLRAFSEAGGGGSPLDISMADGFDDFVNVSVWAGGGAVSWAAVRRNGEVVSNQPGLAEQDDVARVFAQRAVLDRDGRLEVFGGPAPGIIDEVIHADIGSNGGVAVRRDGGLEVWGEAYDAIGAARPPSDLSGVALAAQAWDMRNLSSHAVLADGTVLSWGKPDAQRLMPESVPPLTQLDSGWRHFLGLDREGNVHAWGPGSPGARIPDDLGRALAIEAQCGISAAQMEDLSWVAWGDDAMGVRDKINAIGPALDLAFEANGRGWGHLLWIEPVDASAAP